MNSREPVFFDPAPVTPGNAYIFLVQAAPLVATLEYSYLLTVPTITVGAVTAEISFNRKWFPKGLIATFPVPVYDSGTPSADINFGLLPIEIFKDRSQPPVLNVTVAYEDALVQPLGFGI